MQMRVRTHTHTKTQAHTPVNTRSSSQDEMKTLVFTTMREST